MPETSPSRKIAWLAVFALAVAGGLAGARAMIGRLERPEPVAPASSGKPLSELPDICVDKVFENVRYIVCTADPAGHDIRLALKEAGGKAYGSVKAFAAAADPKPLFAMNAGMYHEDLAPVGLYVENGVERAALNIAEGEGNFFLKPNGVFGASPDGAPFIVTTEAYALSKRAVAFATQSGPMLVIDGQIHPKFQPDGMSRHIRNGVGVTAQGRAVFAVTRDPVSLGSFARFFRDEAGCANALFFDGVVSSLAAGGGMVIDSGFPAGPIVAVFAKPPAAGS